MGLWPLPLPASLLFGASPSGFTGNPITDWTDAVGAFDLVDGPTGPTPTTLNGLAAAEFTGTTPDSLTFAPHPFPSHSAGEVWMVVRSPNWARTAGGSIMLGVRGNPGKDFLLRVSGSATLTNPAAVRRMFISTHDGGLVDAVYGGTALAANTTYVLRFLSTGSAWELWLNGAQESLTVEGGSNSGKWFSYVPSTGTPVCEVGTFVNLAAFSFDGVMPFLMVLPGTLSTAGAQQWFRLLMGAYGA